ncbi:MAG: membrane protein insertion efficiency factor YidD [Victivallales bacterium]|nr:membrane protein insertion efficiency factor YidD [Victivallales bacterium]MBT7166070.1 membrane protein insertion efficiency factor YidD [Victivallales bacterium]MBT7298287.1 membrane protein insertion efficiency factor YidD [Victivallales bacterium]
MFRSAALLLLAGYRKFLSPLKRPCCRFHPTCSVYAQQALRTHGFWRGSWLALRRVLRCHPYHHGPYHDPVPDSHPVPGPNLARRPHHEV